MYLLYFYSVTSWQYATESQRVKKSGERQTRHLNVGLRLLIHIHILRPYYRHQHLCSGADVNSLKPERNVVLASNDDEGARIYNNNNLVKLEEYGHKIKNYYFKFQTNIRICFIIYRTGECILVSEWVSARAIHSSFVDQNGRPDSQIGCSLCIASIKLNSGGVPGKFGRKLLLIYFSASPKLFVVFLTQ